MFGETNKLLKVATLGAALVTTTIAVPLAVADPPTIPAPIPKASAPRLGERLTGQDRVWLKNGSQSPVSRPGEQLSGADRKWLASASNEKPLAQPSGRGFDWGDAGVGAGTAAFAILIAAGSALMIRRRATPAH